MQNHQEQCGVVWECDLVNETPNVIPFIFIILSSSLKIFFPLSIHNGHIGNM